MGMARLLGLVRSRGSACWPGFGWGFLAWCLYRAGLDAWTKATLGDCVAVGGFMLVCMLMVGMVEVEYDRP